MTKDAIFQARTQRKWTQDELARRLDVTPTTVNRWEKGRAEPSRMARRLLREIFPELKEQ